MHHQKGFSLVEVLISLMLITTLALSLLSQYVHSKQFLMRLIMPAKASFFLDQVDEFLIGNIGLTPSIPETYHLIIKKKSNDISLNLQWVQTQTSMQRAHHSIGCEK